MRMSKSDRVAVENRLDVFQSRLDTHIRAREHEIEIFYETRMKPLEVNHKIIDKWVWVAITAAALSVAVSLTVLVVVIILHHGDIP